MSQSRIDYWWKYIQNTELFYNMSVNNIDQNIDSHLYEQLKRLIDYIYGFDTDQYLSGILYGLKVVPYGQNIFISEDAENSSTNQINYNTKCVNLEYSSSPNGNPVIELGTGALSVNDNIYIPDNTNKPLEFINPPTGLKDVILTSSIYFDTDIFLDAIENNSKISQSIAFSTQIEYLNNNSQYILQSRSKEFKFEDDYSIYIRNILNEEYFPQIEGENIFNIAKIIWRISDTTSNDTDEYKYEYFIIDCREIFGRYGLHQIEGFSLINVLYDGINFSDTNLVDLIKSVFSYLFNDMSGTGNEFSPDFITYWTDQGKTISTTIQSLYDELYEGD